MGHQSQESNNELKVVEAIPKEKERENNFSHPFLEKNDVTFLSIINPLLSPNAQKLVSFFINFGNTETNTGFNINELLNQFNSKAKPSGADLLPSLLGLASNSDLKNALNPALLTTLFTMLGNNKKEE